MTIHHCLVPLALVAIVTACNRADNRPAHASDSSTTSATKMDGKETAMSQSNAKHDLDHLAEIRKAIVADDTLSMGAKNVQILTKDGHVTLRGKVANSLERAAVESHARACAATKTLDSEVAIDSQ